MSVPVTDLHRRGARSNRLSGAALVQFRGGSSRGRQPDAGAGHRFVPTRAGPDRLSPLVAEVADLRSAVLRLDGTHGEHGAATDLADPGLPVPPVRYPADFQPVAASPSIESA